MSARHGDNKVGFGGNFGRKLACREPGGVAAQLLKNVCSIAMDPVTDDRTGAGARRRKIRNRVLIGVRGCQSLRSGRSTNVSRADEQDMHHELRSGQRVAS